MPANKSKPFWIYILECENNKYYTGYTTDIDKRLSLHQNGKGAKYTRMNKPVQIAQCWKLIGTKSQAMKIEAFIKQKKRPFKDRIVKNPSELKVILSEELDINFKLLKYKI